MPSFVQAMLLPALAAALAFDGRPLLRPPPVRRCAWAPVALAQPGARASQRPRPARATARPPPPPLPPLPGPVALEWGSVVEVWHADELHVGNFRGRAAPPSRALLVELSSAAGVDPNGQVGQGGGGDAAVVVKVDAGQLVGVWPLGEVHTPTDPAAWAQIHRRAASLLSDLPPHALDLNPLWQRLVSAPAKRRVITPTGAAEALFTPVGRSGGVGRVRGVTPIGGISGAPPPRYRSPAEAAKVAEAAAVEGFARRVAAGKLLAEERIMFRRQPLTVEERVGGEAAAVAAGAGAVPAGAAAAAGEGAAEAPGAVSSAAGLGEWRPVLTGGGGFRALQRAQVAVRAQLSLFESLAAARRGEAIAWAASELPLLAELEMAALGE